MNEIFIKKNISISSYILSFMLCLLTFGASRFMGRMYGDAYVPSKKREPAANRALIVGAGSAGRFVLQELKQAANSDIYPVAFIDDDPFKKNLQINGLTILGGREKIKESVEKYNISTLIIAMPSVPKSEIKKIIDICKETACYVKILPSISDMVSGKISIQTIRDIDVEDLLGREPVSIDLGGIASYISDRVILVTGAGGSIGSELCRQIVQFKPSKLLLLGHGENSIYKIYQDLLERKCNIHLVPIIADIQDKKCMEKLFASYSPQVVFHAAAHKHVPLMELYPAEAIKNNVFGTKNIAEMADKYKVERFVMVSSDKAVNPTSIMGVTKRVAEMVIQGINNQSETNFSIVRFGNVLGSRGSVIPLFKRQIANGGPVTVTHPEMVRYFMTIPEAAQLVIQAGAFSKSGELFLLDMGSPVKIDQLARDLIRLSGFEPDKDIEIVYTGIRPGEKLYEELLTSQEGTRATQHNRIFIAQPELFLKQEIDFYIKQLEEAISSNSEEIRMTLKTIVPNFQWKVNEKEQKDVQCVQKYQLINK